MVSLFGFEPEYTEYLKARDRAALALLTNNSDAVKGVIKEWCRIPDLKMPVWFVLR